ncbi:MAG: acylphosphatase [Patescibacteria group bacterium]|nr:acylphosphatase [Patescibacteria group bacterium]
MERLQLRITGDVQGVGFRYQALQEARRRGFNGWVRNERDGSVTVVVEGRRERLQKFLDWCYTGVRAARVTGVYPQWAGATQEYKDFSIQF